jgi:hypothetical protein
MHERNQPPALHPFIAAFQWVLRHTPVGQWLVQVSGGLVGRCFSQHMLAHRTRH